jgi:hypothetical protein
MPSARAPTPIDKNSLLYFGAAARAWLYEDKAANNSMYGYFFDKL